MSKRGHMVLSAALSYVQSLYERGSRGRNWFKTPVTILIDVCGDIPVRKVTQENLIEWELEVTTKRRKSNPLNANKPLSPHTVDSYKRAIRAFFNHLVNHKFIKKSPVTNAVRFENVAYNEPKHLTDEEVEKMIDVASANPRDYAVVQLFRASGVRLSGIVNLRLSDVCIEEYEIPDDELEEDELELVKLARDANLDHMIDVSFLRFYEGEITVIEKGHRGKQHIHKALIDHDACVAVLGYLKVRPKVLSDRLWLGVDNKPVTAGAIYHSFKMVARKAGINASPHMMRHTFAYKMLDNGVDVKTVAEMLHHRSFKTTLEVYINPRRDDIRRKYRQITRSRYNTRHR